MLRIWHHIPSLLIESKLSTLITLPLSLSNCQLILTGFLPVSCPSAGFKILLVSCPYQLIVCPLLISSYCIEIPQHTPAASGWGLAWPLFQLLESYSLHALLLPCSVQAPSCPLHSSFLQFISFARISLNAAPCNGFVCMLAHISSAGQYFTLVSPPSILSLIKKNFALMCFVLFPLKNQPFFICSSVLFYLSRV
jgi:hypothetical protein